MQTPFRYRGYYYDTETGLYSLQSRYYDPTTGRFLNADATLNPSTGLVGMNLFAYCTNNPVNMTDSSGCFPFLAITAIVGAVVGAVVGGIIAAETGNNVWAGIAIGAAAGGLIGLGLGAVAGELLAGSAIAETSAAIAGAGALASQASNTIGQAVTKVADKVTRASPKVTQVYRSVSSAEADDIQATGKFNIAPGAMEVKQFALSIEETKKFGEAMGQRMIAQASVPNNMLNQLCKVGVDPSIFRAGTITVPYEQLGAFNQAVAGTINIFE